MFYFIFLCNSVEFPQAFDRNPEPVVPEMQQSEEPLQMNGGRLGKILLFSSSLVFFNSWLPQAHLFLKGRGIDLHLLAVVRDNPIKNFNRTSGCVYFIRVFC